jgi:biopolymer transport protein ExbD
MRVTSPVPYKRACIEIIPLIDIMFFVLAGFMMVSLSQSHMKGIRVNPPAGVAPPPSTAKDYVAKQVREGNAVYFDNQYVSPTEQRRKKRRTGPATIEKQTERSGSKR